MRLEMCLAKLHRLTVTDGDLDYPGSITIDELILKAAGIMGGKMVQINNLSNAATWQTYLVPGKPGDGEVILNGPPARLFQRGDLVVVLAKGLVTPTEAWRMHKPTTVHVDVDNVVCGVEKFWRPDIPDWETLSKEEWDVLYEKLKTGTC